MHETWPAPAKLNLYLHVTGRRADGYHTLDTLFQFLDHGDALRFEITPGSQITRAEPLVGVAEDQDLTVRAARTLQARSGVSRGVVIHLTKRLPQGGGLGGGSSDAATTLLVLNHLWACGLDMEELAALGLSLGADVPVFVRGLAARAEGVGEVLQPAEPPESAYVVLVPPLQVSTAAVFAAWDREFQLTPPGTASRIRGFRAAPDGNDLEPIVRRLYPPVDNALRWLEKFGSARMTGSGACVFLPVESVERGREILIARPAELADGFVAQGMNRHPLHVRLYGENWGVAKR